VDNRECGVCHRTDTGGPLKSFDRHPEFAIVRAQATAGVGMKFSHAGHLPRVAGQRSGETCGACHDPTADRRAFAPISFDRHCASCHTNRASILTVANSEKALTTELINGTLLALPGSLPAGALGSSRPTLEDEFGEIRASRLRHRDEWVLFNMVRLRGGIDPDGEESERLTLRSQRGYLEGLLRARPPVQVSSAALSEAIASLVSEIAELDRRLAQPASADQDTRALAQLAETSRAIAQRLAGLERGLDADLRTVAAAQGPPSSAPALESGSPDAALFERRKAELLAVLNRIKERSPSGSIRERADRLRDQVAGLSPRPGNPDRGSLLSGLASLENVFGALRAIPDTGIQEDLARLDLERRLAQQRVAAGLSPDDFEGRRRELLILLDRIDARGNEALRLRAGALRQRVVALRPGTMGDEDLARLRRQRQRQLERLRFELELRQSSDAPESVPAQALAVDRPGIDAALRQIRTRLFSLDGAPVMEEASDASALADRRDAASSLLSRCLKCHTLDAAGAQLAPVRIAQPVMPRSIFNHTPHVTRASCEACHGSKKPDLAAGQRSIWVSDEATDVNVPARAVCATCHAPSKTRDRCETCHVYHASSPATLVSLTP
jgi:hypothetical protein